MANGIAHSLLTCSRILGPGFTMTVAVSKAKAPRRACAEGLGSWNPPRVRGRKMRLGEVNQALRRRPVIRPAMPTSAAAPGAGTAAVQLSNVKLVASPVP